MQSCFLLDRDWQFISYYLYGTKNIFWIHCWCQWQFTVVAGIWSIINKKLLIFWQCWQLFLENFFNTNLYVGLLLIYSLFHFELISWWVNNQIKSHHCLWYILIISVVANVEEFTIAFSGGYLAHFSLIHLIWLVWMYMLIHIEVHTPF